MCQARALRVFEHEVLASTDNAATVPAEVQHSHASVQDLAQRIYRRHRSHGVDRPLTLLEDLV